MRARAAPAHRCGQQSAASGDSQPVRRVRGKRRGGARRRIQRCVRHGAYQPSPSTVPGRRTVFAADPAVVARAGRAARTGRVVDLRRGRARGARARRRSAGGRYCRQPAFGASRPDHLDDLRVVQVRLHPQVRRADRLADRVRVGPACSEVAGHVARIDQFDQQRDAVCNQPCGSAAQVVDMNLPAVAPDRLRPAATYHRVAAGACRGRAPGNALDPVQKLGLAPWQTGEAAFATSQSPAAG